MSDELYEVTKRIRLLLFDCDGVFTDGRLYYGEAGEVLKVFDVQDGLGIVRWHQAGFHSGIISGRNSPIVERRARELGIRSVVQGSQGKLPDAKKISDDLGIDLSETAFVGDDLPDIELIEAVGFGVAVANAVEPARTAARYVTASSGGRGAVREVVELLLASRD